MKNGKYAAFKRRSERRRERIKLMASKSIPRIDIAKKFGISLARVSQIVSGK